jgi:acylphosphatase
MLKTRLLFFGKVQGVGFRRRASLLALQHGLAGFARNLQDGSVEVCLEGELSAISSFIEEMKRLFQVDQVLTSQCLPCQLFKGFTVF